MTVYAKSKLFPGKEYAYDGLVGTKTGYTEYARQTLVSCAKKNGMKLVCVILKEESPAQYTDTLDLFEYGFNNFETINGYLISKLEHIPDKKEKFEYNYCGYRFKVLSVGPEP